MLPLQSVLLPVPHARFLAGLSDDTKCSKDIVIRDENPGSGASVVVPQFHLVLVGAAGRMGLGVGKVCWGQETG